MDQDQVLGPVLGVPYDPRAIPAGIVILPHTGEGGAVAREDTEAGVKAAVTGAGLNGLAVPGYDEPESAGGAAAASEVFGLGIVGCIGGIATDRGCQDTCSGSVGALDKGDRLGIDAEIVGGVTCVTKSVCIAVFLLGVGGVDAIVVGVSNAVVVLVVRRGRQFGADGESVFTAIARIVAVYVDEVALPFYRIHRDTGGEARATGAIVIAR